MSANSDTVQRYMDGFNQTNHKVILDCLTDDVVWDLPGGFHLIGKAAFDKEIENPAFISPPTIKVIRVIEQNDVVVAEGTVRCAQKNGGVLNAVFCDVFVMQNAKIKHLTSYLMEVPVKS